MGGTFDPPHIAHLVGARRAMEQLRLDSVIFVPTNIPPHKPPPVANQEDRLEMTRLAIKDEENFVISDYEIKKGGISYTYQTIEYFYSKGYEIYLLIGEDSLINLNKWKNYKMILQMSQIAWFPRIKGQKLSDQVIPPDVMKNSIRVDMDILEISSSKIREYIKAGVSVKWLVPNPVIEYINRKKLYR